MGNREKAIYSDTRKPRSVNYVTTMGGGAHWLHSVSAMGPGVTFQWIKLTNKASNAVSRKWSCEYNANPLPLPPPFFFLSLSLSICSLLSEFVTYFWPKLIRRIDALKRCRIGWEDWRIENDRKIFDKLYSLRANLRVTLARIFLFSRSWQIKTNTFILINKCK